MQRAEAKFMDFVSVMGCAISGMATKVVARNIAIKSGHPTVPVDLGQYGGGRDGKHSIIAAHQTFYFQVRERIPEFAQTIISIYQSLPRFNLSFDSFESQNHTVLDCRVDAHSIYGPGRGHHYAADEAVASNGSHQAFPVIAGQ